MTAPAGAPPRPLRHPVIRTRPPAVARRAWLRWLGLLALVGAVAAAALASVAYGSKPIPLGDVLDAFFAFDGSNDHLIVRSLRVPRTAVGLGAGIALGLAGALMQGVTRNPLADPGILGVNAGASLGVVIAIYAFGISDLSVYVWFAFAGTLVAAVVVYGLGSLGREGATPVKLALAGAAVSALLSSLTSAVLLLDIATLDQFRFWAVGSLAGRNGDVVRQVVPFLVAGTVLALASTRSLNALSLGDDVARSLGSRVAWPVPSPPPRSCCWWAPPSPLPGQSGSSGSPSPTWPAPSAGRTTAGSFRTRRCWHPSCSSSPTWPGGSSPVPPSSRSAS